MKKRIEKKEREGRFVQKEREKGNERKGVNANASARKVYSRQS